MILRKMNTNNKGFSLVELMIVVAIIGLLAAIGVPQYAKFQARARQSEAKAALGALYSSQQAFFQEWNCYSSDLRNVGFGVTGTGLRYYTGLRTAATGTPDANVAACNAGTPAVGGAGLALSDGATVSPATQAAWNAQVIAARATIIGATGFAVSGAVVPATGDAFDGVAAGDPKNTVNTATGVDVWMIKQNKAIFGVQNRL